MGLLVLLAGCHGKRQDGDRSVLDRIRQAGRSNELSPRPGELADRGRAEIVEECGKQSYALVSQGLTVSETGLHEDVYVLRDRMTYGGIVYSLDEALRLESGLRGEAEKGVYSREQAECILSFAAHLETLSQTLVEADARLKELDASAFTNSTKEAERQAERKLRGTEKAAENTAPPLEEENY